MDKPERQMMSQGLKDLLTEKGDIGDELDGEPVVDNLSEPVVNSKPSEQSVEQDFSESKAVVSKPGLIEVDDAEILHSFVQESRDHLEDIEERLLRLEKTGDPAVIDEVFRSMHTMKGSSAFLGFDKIKELSHSLESLLDSMRSGGVNVSSDVVDILLDGTDILTRMIEEIHQSASKLESKGKVKILDTSFDATQITSKIDAASRARQPAEDKEEQGGSLTFDSAVTDDLIAKFTAEAFDLLDDAEGHILELEKNPEQKSALDGAFRCIHTIKGNAGFVGFDTVEKICMELEGVFDNARRGGARLDSNSTSIMLTAIDSLRRSVAEKSDSAQAKHPGNDVESEVNKPVGELLVEMGAVTSEDVEIALNSQDRRIGQILVDQGKTSEETVQAALESQPKDRESTTNLVGAERRDIRVDMVKLDKLFDLMGELITAEAMVIHDPEIEEIELENFGRAASYLSKITREMQEITMTVRMIPLEAMFNKMRRLVRDLSKRFSKTVNLEVSGQETEMDRNVIEEIADPLMHIIRNAIDHGIEDPEERKKAGKSEVGSLKLGARYEGNEIWISVADDGSGLDRERILAKAGQSGLLRAETTESLTDAEVWQLVFEPGFSTAEQVSEISGRGVGMDVVKRNIEKLRGKIDIESKPSEGCEITLKIPLTLAIIDGITAGVGDVLYAIPLGDILEFHKASEAQVTRTNGHREVLKLREDIIPIVKLHLFFGTPTDRSGVTDGILIITHQRGMKAALLVDEVVGYQQIVVKALPDYLGSMRAISGCAILGNGEVSLIIDVGELSRVEFE